MRTCNFFSYPSVTILGLDQPMLVFEVVLSHMYDQTTSSSDFTDLSNGLPSRLTSSSLVVTPFLISTTLEVSKSFPDIYVRVAHPISDTQINDMIICFTVFICFSCYRIIKPQNMDAA